MTRPFIPWKYCHPAILQKIWYRRYRELWTRTLITIGYSALLTTLTLRHCLHRHHGSHSLIESRTMHSFLLLYILLFFMLNIIAHSCSLLSLPSSILGKLRSLNTIMSSFFLDFILAVISRPFHCLTIEPSSVRLVGPSVKEPIKYCSREMETDDPVGHRWS